MGVCGARPGLGAWVTLAFSVQGADLCVSGGVRAPGGSRVWRGRPCAHWAPGDGVTRWRGLQRPQAEAGRGVGPGVSSRASTSQWSLGLARPCRARCFVCVGVCLLVCLQGSCVCQSVCPPACAGSTVRPRGESPCLSTSKEGGSRCHWFFPGCCKEVAIVFFLSLYLTSEWLQVKPRLTLCFPTVPTGTLVPGGTRHSTWLVTFPCSVSMVLEGLLLFAAVRKKNRNQDYDKITVFPAAHCV